MVEVRENKLNFRRIWQMKAEPAFVEDTSSLAVNICVLDRSEENQIVQTTYSRLQSSPRGTRVAVLLSFLEKPRWIL